MVSPVSNTEDNDSNKPEQEEKQEKEQQQQQQKGAGTTTTTTTTIRNAIADKTKSLLRSDSKAVGEPRTHDDFLSRNALRLIEKTFWFIGLILLMFVLVAIFKESVVDKILPLWTLILGGILGWIANGILKGNSNTTTT